MFTFLEMVSDKVLLCNYPVTFPKFYNLGYGQLPFVLNACPLHFLDIFFAEKSVSGKKKITLQNILSTCRLGKLPFKNVLEPGISQLTSASILFS